MVWIKSIIMPINTPNPIQDGFSLLTQAIRDKINSRATGRSFVDKKLPTYDELKEKQAQILRPINGSSSSWDGGKDNQFIQPGGIYNKTNPGDPSNRTDRNLIIKDLTTFEEIKIQWVPQELDYSPDSNFTSIASMGRNNPFYHFTGSEDTLKFTLDWYGQEESREDVLRNCKKLEALSKNDGYDGPPHRIKLIWNSIMFSDATWLVVSAPYKMLLYQAHRNMLPQQAYQSVTLKKVTSTNMTSNDIRKLTT